MCQFTNVIIFIYFFNLIIELITCDLLCLFTGAVLRYYETKRSCSSSHSKKTGRRQLRQRRTTSYTHGVSPLLVQYDF